MDIVLRLEVPVPLDHRAAERFARGAGEYFFRGTLEPGKDGDLCLWSGEPFQATSRVVGVVLDGELVVDPRGGE